MKKNVSITISIPYEIKESLDMIIKAINSNGGKLTKGQLLASIYLDWLDAQTNDIKKGNENNA